MEQGLEKYFVAIIPPQPIYEEALQFKEYFRDHYNSKGALNSPPHITLHMPFQWKKKRENELIEKTALFAATRRTFEIALSNFNCFEPRVIFIDVMENPELRSLQKDMQKYYRTEFTLLNSLYKDQPFHPHLTVAFRDLKKTAFAQAWKEFQHREFKALFMATKITVLKHNGKVWERFQDFLLA